MNITSWLFVDYLPCCFLHLVREEDLICIENINKKKIWGTTNDSKVILENFAEDKDGQLWKKGEPNAEGYFTLENYRVSKLVTAASSTSLELKGNIHLECAKTRKYPKPDPTRNFRVFWCLTWNFIKWNPARPGTEFSGSGFFPGFRVSRNIAHPTNSQRGVKKFRERNLLLLLLLLPPPLLLLQRPVKPQSKENCCFLERRTKYWNVIGQLLLQRVGRSLQKQGNFSERTKLEVLRLLGRLGSKAHLQTGAGQLLVRQY